jgi:rhodanese-related sulfurtransferase
VLWIAVSLSIAATAAPIISVDNVAYDFGSAIAGTIVSHKFLVTNAGDADLNISSVRASCGCTTTGLPDNSLSPGESVELEARVDTTNFTGQIGKAVYVDSNDPATPTLTLHITGKVIKANDFRPYNMTAGDLGFLLFMMIDLRGPSAYAGGHLIGAVNIPYDELPQWIDRLPMDLLIVLYDQDGSTANAAAELMLAAGYSNVQSLYGGLDNWRLQFGDEMLLTAE